MAHIFSFDPSPPHPSSPWNEQAEDDSAGTISRRRRKSPLSSKLGTTSSSGNDEAGEQKSGKGLVGTKGLISEPQVGATEYKLHLLKEGKSSIRLEQLTTQLLWRLQQSNPNFSNAPGGGSNKPQHIRDSLQDSQGALYELGVCDDGTLVGLLEEELEESLDTLRLMASRLGCAVWVLRKVAIGEVTPEDAARNSSENYRAGEWDDREDMGRRRGSKTGTLWVAEAFVKPIISKEDGEMGAGKSSSESAPGGFFKVKADIVPPATEQLKVSLTGTTTSGKSTLLGTLTSSQPDNGRGKSRLGLFRHRHELVSGVTSSVAQEILGYKPYSTVDYRGGEVINYSYGNISSWTDVHTAISNIHAVPDTDRNGRVVLLSDTAGHPRYRRTTIRSLVGWAPNYALLLIPGDEDELSDASKRHLQLVLKLGLRLVVLITKLDVARREGLRKVLGEILTTLRQARREPQTLSSAEKNIGIWSDKEEQNVRKLIERIEILDEEHPGAGGKVVPVVFISSVSGVGIGTLHALLRGLPIPKEGTRKETLDANDGEGLVPIEGSSLEEVMDGLGKVKVVERDVDTGPMLANRDETGENQEHHVQPVETLFHIEEVYALPSTYTYFPEVTTGGAAPPKAPEGAIVSGHLRYGRISVGDELVVGPFNTRAVETGLASRGAEMTRSISTGSLPSKKKGTLDLSPSNSPFLLASSAGSFGKRGWLSDEEGTGISSGDEQNRDAKFRRPRSALAKGGSLGRKLSGEVGDVGDAEEFQHHQQQRLQGEEWRVARVVSVRRLRLPVGTLFQGEAGTVGLVCLGVYKASVVNPDDAKAPEITVETVAEEKEEDEEEGGVSLLVDGGVSVGGKAIVITDEANKQEGGVVNNETPSGTTKVVSFATDNTITAISNSNAGVTQPPTTTSSSEFRLRKGMVIINQTVPAWDKVNAKNKPEWPVAYNGFLTVFTSEDDDFTGVRSGGVTVSSLTIGTHVVVYCASIRAAARVVEVPGYSNNNNNTSELKGGLEISTGKERRKKSQPQEEIDVFGFEDEDEDGSGIGGKEGEEDGESERKVFVGFEFLGGNEWVEVGAKVLVTSGQGRGLDGLVGKVVRVGL